MTPEVQWRVEEMRKQMPPKEGSWWIRPIPHFHIARNVTDSLIAMDRRGEWCHYCGEKIENQPAGQDIGPRRCESCVEAIRIVIEEYRKPQPIVVDDCPYI